MDQLDSLPNKKRRQQDESNDDSDEDDRATTPVEEETACDADWKENGTEQAKAQRTTGDDDRNSGDSAQKSDSGEPLLKKRRKDVSPAKYFELIEELPDPKTNNCIKYGCARCGKIYKWKKSLNKHWKEKHDGDLGDNSDTPPGMKSLLEQGNYCKDTTSRRKCVQKDFYEKIVVKEDDSQALEEAEASQVLGGIGRGDNMGGSTDPVKTDVPAGAFISGMRCQHASTSIQKMLVVSMNGPIASSELNQFAVRLTDETDGNQEEVDIGEDVRSQEGTVCVHDVSELQGSPGERPASSSSYASSVEQSQAARGPGITPELEKVLQKLDELDAACGPLEDRGVLACPQCPEVLTTQTKYGNHLATHMPSACAHRLFTKCAVCRRHFADKKTLNQHFGQQHKDMLLSVMAAVTIPNGRLSPGVARSDTDKQCTQCEFVAKFPAELSKHRVSHSQERPWKCVICASSYKRMSDLQKHFSNTHRGLCNPYKSARMVSSFGGRMKALGQPEVEKVDQTHAEGNSPTATGFEDSHHSVDQPAASRHERSSSGIGRGHLNSKDSSIQTPSTSRQAVRHSGVNAILPLISVINTSDINTVRQTRETSSRRTENDNIRKMFKCHKCNFRCWNLDDFISHRKGHDSEIVKGFACTYCSYRSKHKSDVGKHEKRCAGAGHGTGKDTRATAQEAGSGVTSSLEESRTSTVPEASQQPVRSPATSWPALAARLHAATPLKPQQGEVTQHCAVQMPVSLTWPAFLNRVVDANSGTGAEERQVDIKCVLCPFETSSRTALRDHMDSAHTDNTTLDGRGKTQKKFSCEKCRFGTERLRTLIKHRQVHKNDKDSEQRRHSPIMNGALVDDARLRHPRKAVQSYSCSSCTFVCTKNTDFIQHREDHSKNTCKWCTERWDNKENYLDHIVVHEEFDPDDSEWETFFMSKELMNNEDLNNNEGDAQLEGKASGNPEAQLGSAPTSARRSSSGSGSQNTINCEWCGLACSRLFLVEHCARFHPEEYIEMVLNRPQEIIEGKTATDVKTKQGVVSPAEGNTGQQSTAKVSTVDAQTVQDCAQQMVESDSEQNCLSFRATLPGTENILSRLLYPVLVPTCKGVPVQLLTDEDQVQYKCMFCLYSHKNPASVVRHVQKARHSLPKKYICFRCITFQSDEVQEVIAHQISKHSDSQGSIMVLVFSEIQDQALDSTQHCGGEESPPRCASSNSLAPLPQPTTHIPSNTATLLPACKDSDTEPLDLSCGKKRSQQTATPETHRLPIAPQNHGTLVQEAMPPRSHEKNKTVTRLFTSPRSRKGDIKAQEIMPVAAKEAGARLVAAGTADVKQVLLYCKHCPFKCLKDLELRYHSIFHGLKARYTCDYCSFSHQELRDILVHRSVHRHEENFTCTYNRPSFSD